MNNLMTHDQLTAIAQTMVKGNLLGCKSVDQAIGLMLIAQAEGKHPATVSKEYHIINGKPALSAEAMLARFQAAGGSINWTQKSDQACSAVFSHPQGGSVEIAWDVARATKAELKSPTWKKFAQQMLSARVISEGVRSCFPGCIEGFYVAEEQEDIPERRTVNSLADAMNVADAKEKALEVESVEIHESDTFELPDQTIDEKVAVYVGEIEGAGLAKLRILNRGLKDETDEVKDAVRPFWKARKAQVTPND